MRGVAKHAGILQEERSLYSTNVSKYNLKTLTASISTFFGIHLGRRKDRAGEMRNTSTSKLIGKAGLETKQTRQPAWTVHTRQKRAERLYESHLTRMRKLNSVSERVPQQKKL